jgi:hypothetical protein
MRLRYLVYDGDRPFASVHAATVQVAITSACLKVTGHTPSNCTATCVSCKREERFALEPWSILDWDSSA